MANKNCAIDFIKLLYSLIIVGLHSVYLMNDGIRRIFPHGYLAVEFFFIISGYFMAESAFNKDIRVEEYIISKYRRLLPYIIFAWCVGAMIIVYAHPEMTRLMHAQNFLESIWQVLMLDLAGFNGYQVIGAFWYLSAMFLSMPLLYYLIKEKTFCIWGGDILLAVFIYGWFSKNYGLIINASGEMYEITALLRAFAGISLGCFSYRISCKLKQLRFTYMATILLTLLESGGYLLSFVIICRPWTGKADVFTFLIILAWAISVPITFSQKSFSSVLNRKSVERYSRNVAMFSTALYLCHGRMQSFVINVFPTLTSFEERVIPYYMISIIVAIICVFFVKGYHKFFDKYKKKFVIT